MYCPFSWCCYGASRIEGGGHCSKCRSSWVIYYIRAVTFLELETVESVTNFHTTAGCYLVITEEAEKVIHTVQATGVRLSNDGHDRAPLHPQDIRVGTCYGTGADRGI